MLREINGYQLDSHVDNYNPFILLPFDDSSYQLIKQFGIQRMFKNEEFYWMQNNVVLGTPFNKCIASAIDGYIRKICFGFMESIDNVECVKNDLWEFMSQYGKYNEKQVVQGGALYYWDSPDGNIVLESFPISVSLILTSSQIKLAKRLGFFDKIFGH